MGVAWERGYIGRDKSMEGYGSSYLESQWLEGSIIIVLVCLVASRSRQGGREGGKEVRRASSKAH